MLEQLDQSQGHQLDYTIHSCSNCSATYHPFNILNDSPTEPSSRWSGSGPPHPSPRPIDPPKPSNNHHHHHHHHNLDPKSDSDSANHNHNHPIYSSHSLKKKDYIIIDLRKPAIVRSITFGKFHRPHPCNVRLFRIWGSLAPGEGQGDFRALLDPQSIHKTHPSSENFKYPSQSNSRIHYSNTSLDDNHSHSHQPNYLSSSTSHPIRARGQRHRAGPRMELLAQGELKNDTVPETVPLRWKNNKVAWFKAPNSSSSLSDLPPSNQTVIVPVRYIKIEPLSAAGSNYNCSIWHISVKGHDEDHILKPCLDNYEQWRASASLRLCLKHLRQTGHFEAFQALLKSAANPSQSPVLVLPPSDSQFDRTVDLATQAENNPEEISRSSDPAQFYFEHPLVSALHSALLSTSLNPTGFDQSTASNSSGRLSPISKAEEIVVQASAEGLFDQWARAEPPTLTCHQIHPRSGVTPSELPCPRGGHQMCIDSKRRKIWLFGGFDGYQDLGDLWVYHLEPLDPSAQEDEHSLGGGDTMNNLSKSTERLDPKYNTWQRISHDVTLDNGPIKRSCHKMVLDEMTGDLYVIGRYTERSRIVNTQASESAESASNGNLFINPDRLIVQTVRISNELLGPQNHPEAESTDMAPEFHENIVHDHTTEPTPRAEISADEPMVTDQTPPPWALSSSSSSNGRFKNDFFRFRAFENPSSDEFLETNRRIGRWECLSQDTYAENGPRLIFDHQMVLDSERRKIYVFGGKIIQPINLASQEPTGSSSRAGINRYSGMFEYDLTTHTWEQLMDDPGPDAASANAPEPPTSEVSIPSRMGHSLILDKKRQCLWILTGERDHHYYSDLWRYDLGQRRAELIIGDYTYRGGQRGSGEMDGGQYGVAPEAGFSQRTTFDPTLDEWHMFCGLCRDRGGAVATDGPSTKLNSKTEVMSSEFWRWRIDEAQWTRVVMKNQTDESLTPPPRFAHQMVFDTLTKTHYVFGGNPADNDNEPTRLGDFWRLKLSQATRREALRRSLFALRRQQFIEMCQTGTNTAGALWYLQNDLSAVTNHSDEREGRLFRACTSHLLAGPGPRRALLEPTEDHHPGDPAAAESEEAADLALLRSHRITLFDSLAAFFPAEATQPTESLADLIDTWGDRDTFW